MLDIIGALPHLCKHTPTHDLGSVVHPLVDAIAAGKGTAGGVASLIVPGSLPGPKGRLSAFSIEFFRAGAQRDLLAFIIVVLSQYLAPGENMWRKGAVVVLGIHGPNRAPLFQIGFTDHGGSLFPDPLQRGQQDGHQNRDDGDDNEKLDQGECSAFVPHALPPFQPKIALGADIGLRSRFHAGQICPKNPMHYLNP